MRVRLPLGRSLLAASVFLFAVVALLPLRLAIDWFGYGDRGLSAREAEGSIWIGALKEARLGSVPVGDVTASLRLAPLFLGRATVDLRRASEADPLRASVTVSRHGFALGNTTGAFFAGTLFAPLPISRVELDGLAARFANGTCTSAEGRVSAQLSGEVAGLALPGGFTGNARCERGALLLPLASQSGLEMLNLRLSQDGSYRAELLVRPTDPALAQRLAGAGFGMTSGGAYGLQVEGAID